jgi:hypothetical protein
MRNNTEIAKELLCRGGRSHKMSVFELINFLPLYIDLTRLGH